MNVTLEFASDWLRSSVSSPGMPKTYRTPSASRHSTKTSDALRRPLIPYSDPGPTLMRTFSPEPSTATRRVMTRSGGVRTVGLLVCLLALACAPSAHAASRLVIRGAGFGHGIGMSQYGAYGFALHGVDYHGDPRRTTTRARSSRSSRRRRRCACCCRARPLRTRSGASRGIGGQRPDPAQDATTSSAAAAGR